MHHFGFVFVFGALYLYITFCLHNPPQLNEEGHTGNFTIEDIFLLIQDEYRERILRGSQDREEFEG